MTKILNLSITQRNTCTLLLRKAERDYYSKLKCSVITDNKTFWRSVKPIFSENDFSSIKITLIDDSNIISDDNLLATHFNDFFSNAVKALDEKKNAEFVKDADDIKDPVFKAVKMYGFTLAC